MPSRFMSGAGIGEGYEQSDIQHRSPRFYVRMMPIDVLSVRNRDAQDNAEEFVTKFDSDQTSPWIKLRSIERTRGLLGRVKIYEKEEGLKANGLIMRQAAIAMCAGPISLTDQVSNENPYAADLPDDLKWVRSSQTYRISADGLVHELYEEGVKRTSDSIIENPFKGRYKLISDAAKRLQLFEAHLFQVSEGARRQGY